MFTSTDDNGNVTNESVVVNIMDNQAPTIELVATPVVVNLDANGNGSIAVSDVVASTFDACNVQTVELSQTAFTCADKGSKVITVSATDVNGNIGTETMTISVVDVIAPTVVVKDTIVVELGANGLATIDPSDLIIDSDDNCAPLDSISAWFTSASDSIVDCSEVGVFQISANVKDAPFGSIGTQTVTDLVTVVVKDVTAPQVSVATPSINAYMDATGIATIDMSSFGVNATDACGISSEVLSQTVFGCQNMGANTITYTATDVNGNTESVNLFVSVMDTVSPLLTADANVTVDLNASGNATIDLATVSAITTDNNSCGTVFMELSQTEFDCSHAGSPVVVDLTSTDASNNSTTIQVNVTVVDNIDPVAMAIDTLAISLDATGSYTINQAMVETGSSDNCGIVNSTLSDTVITCADLGTKLVDYTVFDAAGNSDIKTVVLTVTEEIAPEVQVQNISKDLNSAGSVTVNIFELEVAGTKMDNCGGLVTGKFLSEDATSKTFDCSNVGQNTVTLRYTDARGNYVDKIVIITINDITAPTIQTPTAHINISECEAANGVVYTTPQFQDACGILSVNLIAGLPSGSMFPVGETTAVTYEAIDVNGNKATSSFNVTVSETEEINVPASFTTTACAEATDIDLVAQTPGYPSVRYFGHANISADSTTFTPTEAGTFVLNWVVVANNGCEVFGERTLQVNPAPVNPVIEQVATNQLKVTNKNYASYQWYLNGTAIPNEDHKNLYFDQSGNYTVKVTSELGCDVMSDVFTIGTSNGTSKVEEVNVTVYPNPSNGIFTIDLGSIADAVTIDVIDARGVKVRSFNYDNLEESTIQMELNELSSAMYHLVITKDEVVTRQKIVINK
jgi:hypothetical protein